MSTLYLKETLNDRMGGFNDNSRKRPRKRAGRHAELFLKLLTISLIFVTLIVCAYSLIQNVLPFIETEVVASDFQQTITVQSGDTLWSISRDFAPEGTEFPDYMKQIKKLNHIKGWGIQSGQVLVLP